MQKLDQIIKAQQSGESSALALPGTQQLTRDSLVQMGTMLRQMSAAFPHQEYGQETTEIFLLTFEDLAVEYGLTNLEAVLRKFLSRQLFFPHPAEVRKELDEMASKAKAEVKKALPRIGCPKCHDGGFADGYILKINPDRKREVWECDCMKAYRKAKKEAAA